MRKQIESKIAKAYWKTEAGQNLANTMHSDGWEAVDCLNSVINALENSIEAADATTREELEKGSFRDLTDALKEAQDRHDAIGALKIAQKALFGAM